MDGRSPDCIAFLTEETAFLTEEVHREEKTREDKRRIDQIRTDQNREEEKPRGGSGPCL